MLTLTCRLLDGDRETLIMGNKRRGDLGMRMK